MSDFHRSPGGLSGGGAAILGRASSSMPIQDAPAPSPSSPRQAGSPELARSIAEIKGQAQFLLYLADQLEDSLAQLAEETDPGHATFLCKILGMYSSQLENKHQGLGDKISETCQEVYITVREYDAF